MQSKRKEPIHIEFRRDDNYMYYNVKSKLQEGKVPPFLIESMRWITEGVGSDSDKIISYIKNRVAHKLAIAGTGQKSPDFHVVLCDQPGICTGIITDAKVPILIVGLGMMDMLIEHGYGEDHLAAVVSHERFHLRRHRKWKDIKNGRPEETIGDVYAVWEAEKAGYNPQAMGDFFRTIKNEIANNRTVENDWRHDVGELIDEHAPLDTRIRNSELALANLQLTKRMKKGQTNFPDEIVEAVKKVRFETHFEKYLSAMKYEDASPEKKVNILAGYYGSILDPKDKTMARVYREETRDCVKALRRTEGVQKEALRWFRYFFRSGHEFNRTKRNRHFYNHSDAPYEFVLNQFVQLMGPTVKPRKPDERWRSTHVDSEDVVPPVYQRLKTDTQAFWDAKTREEAVTAAKRYHQAKKSLRRYHSGIYALGFTEVRKSSLDRYTIKRDVEKGKLIRFPWEDHVQWARGEGETPESGMDDSELINQIAQELGCRDPRLPNNSDAELDSDYSLDDLTFDEDGNITAIKLTRYELQEIERKKLKARYKADTAADLLDREYKLQKQREVEEAALVKKTDFSAMEEDFWGFVTNNKKHLSPAVTLVPGKFPYAQAFMEHLEALREKDPNTWNPIYVTFLTGFPDNKRTKERENYDGYGDREERMAPHRYAVEELIQSEMGRYSISSDGTWLERGELPAKHPMASILASYMDGREPQTKKKFNKASGAREEYTVYPRKINPTKHPVKVPFKVDIRHPYAKAIANLKEEESAPRDKARIMERFRYSNPQTDNIDRFFKISSRRIYNYSSLNTPADFEKIGNQARRDFGYQRIFLEALPIELLRTFRKLDKNPAEERYPISEFDFFWLSHDFWILEDKKVARAHQRELKTLVERQIRRNRKLDFSAKNPLHKLIENYLKDHGTLSSYEYHKRHLNGRKSDRKRYRDNSGTHNIFMTRPELDKAYQKHIRKCIMKLPVAERHEHLTEIMKLQIQDPEHRAWTVEAWVESSVAMLGIDDSSEEYAKKALDFIKSSVHQVDGAQGLNCIINFLNEIEAQKEVALGAKEILTNTFGRRFFEKDGAMRVIDSAVETCAHDPKLRDAFLKYITEPLTHEGSQDFVKLLKTKITRETLSSQYKFIKKIYNPERAIAMSPSQENMTLDYLHENFWSMPFALRTIYLDRMLFPPRENVDDILDEAIAFVLDKVLPLDKKFAPEAREALMVYLDHCPPELRRTTFSAILATTESASNEGDLRPGQVLSDVLTRTGAAGGQLLQAGHSYLSSLDLEDPDMIQFRDDLKSSKVDFAKPLPWEVFERMDQVMPKEFLESLSNIHVGKVLGSGSTAYVVSTKRSEEEATALKLMREDVVSIADLQFERFFGAFTELAKRNDHYKPLPSMVDHARDLIQVSTRGDVAAEQVRYAQKSYDPIKITVDGETFTFKVAPVVSHGEEYLETALVMGEHLNDLEANSEEELLYHKRLSIAIETLEMYRKAQGKAIDQDRHGGQQKITGNRIGIFDVGALPYDLKSGRIAEPTAGEKCALGNLLGLTMNAAADNKPPVEALINAVTTEEWGDAKSYLVGVKRALLARADVYANFGKEPKDKAEVQAAIFHSIWKSGKIAPEVLGGLVQKIGFKPLKKATISALNNTKPAFDIVIQDDSLGANAFNLNAAKKTKIVLKNSLQRTFNAISELKKAPLNGSAVKLKPVSVRSFVQPISNDDLPPADNDNIPLDQAELSSTPECE